MTSKRNSSKQLVALLLALALYSGSDADAATYTNQAYQAAARGLKIFSSLISTQNYRGFGLTSLDQASRLQLAEPLPRFELSLKTLRLASPSQVLSNSLSAPSAMLFPITADQTVRTSLAVRQEGSKWVPGEFGGSRLMRRYAQARDANVRSNDLPPSAFFVVTVPALHAYFIGYPATNQVWLVSVVDAPELRLSNGIPVRAEEVIRRLAIGARRHGVQPR